MRGHASMVAWLMGCRAGRLCCLRILAPFALSEGSAISARGNLLKAEGPQLSV